MESLQGRRCSRRTLVVACGAALVSVWNAPGALAATPCTGTISGATIVGGVVVPTGAVCTLSGDAVLGDVTVQPSATLTVDMTTIRGGLRAGADTLVTLHAGTRVIGSTTLRGAFAIDCGTRFDGNLTAIDGTRTARNQTVSADAVAGCGAAGPIPVRGNLFVLNNPSFVAFNDFNVAGGLIARGNRGGIEFLRDTFGGSGNVRGNIGGVSLSNDSFGGSLTCSGNNPPPSGSGNTGSLHGQCAGLI